MICNMNIDMNVDVDVEVNTDVDMYIDLDINDVINSQYWPGSRAKRPILSSTPRGGGEGDPPMCIGKQEVGTYIYSLLYTHTGLLGRLLLKSYSR